MRHKPPKIDHQSPIKSATYTFNHTHEYAIHEDLLWFRKIGEARFEPLYFDGFAAHERPVFVDSDMSNLIVIDHKRQLHYKKTLQEFRQSELDPNDESLNRLGLAIRDYPYVAFDLNQQNNWQDRWFHLPVLGRIVRAFTKKRLTEMQTRDRWPFPIEADTTISSSTTPAAIIQWETA